MIAAMHLPCCKYDHMGGIAFAGHWYMYPLSNADMTMLGGWITLETCVFLLKEHAFQVLASLRYEQGKPEEALQSLKDSMALWYRRGDEAASEHSHDQVSSPALPHCFSLFMIS